MHLFRKLTCCCGLLAAAVLANGQHPNAPQDSAHGRQDHANTDVQQVRTDARQAFPHTLLWRISGNGLTKASYLFGTMHLNDKRLFHFDDSVYRAIEQMEGLAIEVNPDEMGAYIVNKLFDEMTDVKKLKDVLSDKYFSKHSEALARKFKKPADEISTGDVVKEKNKWMSDLMEKGEMSTFVDAYLYNIARREGKWMGGIEDISDQAGLLDEMVDPSDINDLLAGDTPAASSASQSSAAENTLEKMIGLYSKQDIEGIEALTNEHSTTEQKDLLLIHRNIKMASRIDSLIHLRTLFVAIGAAHLPGDSGVISMLRERGFTLTPVFSKKKIEPEDYHIKDVHLPWTPVADPQGLYTVEMPANPAEVALYDLIKIKFLLDIFNLSGYCTMAVLNPNHTANKDSLLDALAFRIFSAKHLDSKPLQNGGVQGKEYIGSADGANMRIQLFEDDRFTYMALQSAVKKETLVSADADHFFKSFTITKAPEAVASSHVFVDSIMGVRFISPAEMIFNKKLSPTTDKTMKITCMAGSDLPNNAYVMLMSKETRAGMHILSDSMIYGQVYAQFETQYKELKKEEITIQGFQGVLISGENIDQPNLYLHALIIVRNGREIALFTISDSEHLHAPELTNIFSSFSFIAQPRVAWSSYTSPDGAMTCWGPSPFRTYTTKANKQQLLTYDTTTSTSYFVIPDTLNKYSWFPSDSAYWEKSVHSNLEEGVLVEKKDIVNGALKGKELLFKTANEGNSFVRTRLLLDGDRSYQLYVAGEKEFLYSTDVDRFFTSFRMNSPPAPDFVAASKAALVLRDLTSADSATRSAAFTGYTTANFGKADLPLLHEALFKEYRSPYDSGRSMIINNQLAVGIAKLGDPSSVQFIRERYPSLIHEPTDMRNAALSVLGQMHTKESYDALADLLLRFPPHEELPYLCLGGMKDSFALTAGIFPSLQQLARDSAHTPTISDLAIDLIDSGFVKQKTVDSAAGYYLSAAAQLLPPLERSGHFHEHIVSMLQLIGRFNTPSAFKLLQRYLSVKNDDILQEAVLQLLRHDQTVTPVALNKLAADPNIRTVLYDSLKSMKKKALFPGKYLRQAYFAESAMHEAGNIDGDPQVWEEAGIGDQSPGYTFLGKRIAAYKGKRYTFYLYKVAYITGNDSSAYLGIAGGYDLTGIKLNPDIDLYGIYWTKPLDSGDPSAALKAYLKHMASHETPPEKDLLIGTSPGKDE